VDTSSGKPRPSEEPSSSSLQTRSASILYTESGYGSGGEGPMRRVMLPRDRGGKIEITEGTGPITAMISTGEHLEIYKVDKTFRVETPEKIDPKRTNPNAPFTISTIQNVGTSNQIVARVLLQGNQILGLYAGGDKKPILKQLHQCKEFLLRCEAIAKEVRSKIDAVNENVKAAGIPLENSRVLKEFPHIENLEGACSTFLIEANRAIRAISGLPSLFISMERPDKNFHHLAKRLEKKIGANEDVTKFVQSAADDIREVVDLRDYLEHPNATRRTVINNFHLLPDGQLGAPTWHLSGKAPLAIAEDMFEIIEGLVGVVEELLLHLVVYSERERLVFNVQRIPDDQIDRDFPVRYRLVGFLKTLLNQSRQNRK
jgi:hypothetical protein